jgi:hypothetical protein
MTRRGATWAAAAVLLLAPTVIAFWSGGYFAEPRLIAGMAVWAAVVLLCLVGPAPLPHRLAGWLALGGLVLMTAWSALSIAWAPLAGPAVANVERLVLYVGAFALAVGVARLPAVVRAVEPLLAFGAAVVIGEGLSERVLPGLVTLTHSTRAHGRLEQPVTYWNGEGALAAVGFVLCARLAGDRTRPAWLRALAAAATAPLGAGVYLSFSRGAIAAAAVGLVVLVALAPERAQLRGALVALLAGTAAAVAAGVMRGPSALAGTLSDREREGAILLGVLLVVALLAAGVTLLLARRERGRPAVALPGGRRLVAVAGAAVVLVAAGLVVGGLREKPSAAELGTASAGRLVSVSSNRYLYWHVGFRGFRRHPLDGLGSGGFRVLWLRERTIPEGVLEVHSLPLEMAAELGLVGLLALGLLVGGVGASARTALVRHGAAAAGPAAALVTWFLHASIDWDWQLPAVSLPAIALAGTLVALAESGPELARAPDARAVQHEA